MSQDRLTILFEKYISNECTEAEKTELAAFILAARNDSAIAALLETTWMNTKAETDMPEEKANSIFTAILEKERTDAIPVHKGRLIKIWRVAAAAAIIIVAGYFLLVKRPQQQAEVVQNHIQAKDVQAPVSNRAIITLANGTQLALGSAANGQLALQDNVKLTKQENGHITYEAIKNGTASSIKYNTLTNPRGSQVVDMMLADGSHVWLNAGSSITYPVSFVGLERKVNIDGEAYFEVTHDAAKPFIVTKGEVQVQVLGTHFNVNAYDDESDIKVTLLEGSVKTSIHGSEPVVLRPGEQARIHNDIRLVKNVDTDMVMGWKNGLFAFNQADLQTIMRSVARWYDVDVVYEGKATNRKFGGEIPRMNNVSKVLKVLEESGVKFRIEERKIIVE